MKHHLKVAVKPAAVNAESATRTEMQTQTSETPEHHSPDHPQSVHTKPLNLNLKPAKNGAASVAIHLRPGGHEIQKTPESLPVLEAFQEFLDSERRKMRNRMLALSFFFTFVIIVISGAALFTGYILLNPVKSDVAGIQTSLKDIQNHSTSVQQSTESAISRFNEILEQEKLAMVAAKSSIETQVGSYDNNIENMQEIIAKLRDENMSLKQDVVAIHKNLPVISENLNRIMSEIASVRAQTIRETEKQSQPESPVRITNTESSRANIVASFIPRGSTSRVTCYLPIPE